MFCSDPKCPDFLSTGVHGEFVTGITTCPFCEGALVEQLPEETSESEPMYAGNQTPAKCGPETYAEQEIGTIDDLDEDLVSVATFNSRDDADAAMSYLTSCGIDVFESSGDCRGAFRGFADSMHLLVPKSQADEAAALLKEVEKEQDT